MSQAMPGFEKAEYALSSQQRGDECTRCAQPLRDTYFRVGGSLACESCANQAQSAIAPDSHAAFSRAVMYGVGAAVAGMIAYALFEIATGIAIGYLALGVGWLVAKAMKAGSKGRSGRKYQITAALLTYAAVSMAAIPVAVYEGGKHKTAQTSVQRADGTADADAASAAPGNAGVGLGKAVIMLLGVGLASPFLELSDGFSGVIGLVILFVGIRMAWRMMGVDESTNADISGPYRMQAETA